MSANKYLKHILVTGGAGFMGSHMVTHLVNKYPNYFIVNLDKLCYNSSLKNLKSIEGKENYKFIKADVCNEIEVRDVFRKENINTVIHFAALSHVDHSFINALDFNHTNIYGTHVLAKTSCEMGVGRFVLVSTDEVYGGESSVPSTETSALRPTNPYACSKAASELMASSYLHCHQLPLVITRTTNVYGPHKFPETVVPKFICLLLRNRKCCIHGNGQNIRHYMYVSDAIDAYDVILHQGCDGEVYNIGCDFKMNVVDVAKYLVAELKGPHEDSLSHVDFTTDRRHNDHHYSMCSRKLQKLGWKPKVSWKDGVKMTVSWYKDNFKNWPNANDALRPFPLPGISSELY